MGRDLRFAARACTFLTILVVNLFATSFTVADSSWQKAYAEAKAESQKLDRPLLLHFGARWCGPCQAMDANVLHTGPVQRMLSEAVVGVKLDFDNDSDIAEKYHVERVPTDIIIAPDGRELYRNEGYQAVPQYVGTVSGIQRKYVASRPVKKSTTTAKIVENPGKAVIPRQPLPELNEPILGLEGYCPVTLWRSRSWVKGDDRLREEYQGVEFHFASLAERDDFKKDPSRYVPQLLGCDPVRLWETERAFAGSPHFACYFNGELFLFTEADTRDLFKKNPQKYTRTRHVELRDIEFRDTRIGMRTP